MDRSATIQNMITVHHIFPYMISHANRWLWSIKINPGCITIHGDHSTDCSNWSASILTSMITTMNHHGVWDKVGGQTPQSSMMNNNTEAIPAKLTPVNVIPVMFWWLFKSYIRHWVDYGPMLASMITPLPNVWWDYDLIQHTKVILVSMPHLTDFRGHTLCHGDHSSLPTFQINQLWHSNQ